jgi:signal transduction histidine kinase
VKLKRRIPLWLPIVATLIPVIGICYSHYRSHEDVIVDDLIRRKSDDTALMGDFVEARSQDATQTFEERKALLADAIADRHANTEIAIFRPGVGGVRVEIATNRDHLEHPTPDAVLFYAKQLSDRNPDFPDAGIRINRDDIEYLINVERFRVVLVRDVPGAGTAVTASVLFVTNLTAATDAPRRNTIVWGGALVAALASGMGLILLVNVAPLSSIGRSLRTGDPINPRWFWPGTIMSLVEAIEQYQTTAREKTAQAQAYAVQIEENQRIWRHDLLSNIKGVYDMFELLDIIGFTVDDDDHRKTYDMARNAAESAYTLVKETRQLGDLEGNLKLERINVSAIFDALATKYSQNNVVLNYPKNDIIVLIDTNQFTNRALVNLINNAIRYSNPPHERVEVSAVVKDGKVHFLVKDNGLGISPEGIEKIMSGMGEGVRLNPEIPGSGLGLYSVRRILQAHGGALTVKSQLGEGSIFIVTVKKHEH